MVSVVVLLWLILGWDLSYHKAQLTKAVAWVGYRIEAGKDEVRASIKEEFMNELKTLVQDTLKQNTITHAELRSLAGKANHVATLIIAWRPFFGPAMGCYHQEQTR